MAKEGIGSLIQDSPNFVYSDWFDPPEDTVDPKVAQHLMKLLEMKY